MTRSRLFPALLGVLLPTTFVPLLLADPPAPRAQAKPATQAAAPAGGPFLRLVKDAGGEVTALETAIVRYVPRTGQGDLTVDLIGAVHVGDKAYYEKLNRAMEKYDVLLYELVAPPGTHIPKGGRKSDNPLSMVQGMMKTVLGLELQTECIDYTRQNFLHADLSPEQMAEKIKERGDDGLTLALSIAADVLRQQNLATQKPAAPQKAQGKDDDEEFDPLAMLLDPNTPRKLKLMMAEQFGAMEGPGGGLGPTLNKILVEDRNKACLKVFQAELAKGKKKIGIFYGAAHLPDFEKRLKDEFDLKRDSETWLTAWDLRPGRGKTLLEGVLRELMK